MVSVTHVTTTKTLIKMGSPTLLTTAQPPPMLTSSTLTLMARETRATKTGTMMGLLTAQTTVPMWRTLIRQMPTTTEWETSARMIVMGTVSWMMRMRALANNNGVGDVCENDCDGDSVMDDEDACPCNNDIVRTDFRGLMPVPLTTSSNAVWEFRDEGKEIVQKVNSEPEVAVGKTRLAAMEFEGTMFVTANWDDDWIGSVFSFQDTSNFYLFMSSKAGSHQGPWQIKRVSSITGPGSWEMTNAIRRDVSVANQTEVLWKGWKATGTSSGQEEEEALSSYGGWNYDTSYRFHITHLPDQGIIRLKLYEGATLLHDSGDIIDNGEQALRGGRMGVFCYSQQDITWSALSYRCL